MHPSANEILGERGKKSTKFKNRRSVKSKKKMSSALYSPQFAFVHYLEMHGAMLLLVVDWGMENDTGFDARLSEIRVLDR